MTGEKTELAFLPFDAQDRMLILVQNLLKRRVTERTFAQVFDNRPTKDSHIVELYIAAGADEPTDESLNDFRLFRREANILSLAIRSDASDLTHALAFQQSFNMQKPPRYI